MRMSLCVPLAGLLLLVATFSAADAAYSASDAKSYIVSSEEQWLPTNPREVDVIRIILADDFIGLIDGTLYTKADAISSSSSDPGDVASESVDYVKVRFHGLVAIAQGQATKTHKNGRKVRNRFIDTWVFGNHGWKIVAAADTDTPLPP